MALKTILFLLAFAVSAGGALYMPLLGVLGYMLHYAVGPERQWWGRPAAHMGIRFSLTLAVCIGLGIMMRRATLRFRDLLIGQEKLIIAFVGVVWLSVLLGPETVGRFSAVDHPSIKITKILIFVLMFTHVVTTRRDLYAVFWVLAVGALLLGLQAYSTPRSSFVRGRLDTVGGTDFSESNNFASYMGAMLPILAVLFLRSGWKGKALSAICGVFTMNAIVLTRSRGGMIGMAAGAMVAVSFAPRKYRAKIMLGLIAVFIGGFYLSDPQYRERMTTITRETEELDQSAYSRFELASAAGRMFSDHPLGVGAGNFYQTIGRYDDRYAWRDAHNTVVRCFSELGIQGIALFGIILLHAMRMLWRLMKLAQDLPDEHVDSMLYPAYGMAVSITIYFVSGLTATLLYAEAMWWLLAMPICLHRAMENLHEDLIAEGQLHPEDAMFEAEHAAPQNPLIPENTRVRA